MRLIIRFLRLLIGAFFRLMDWVDSSYQLPPVRIQLRALNPGSAEAQADPPEVRQAVDALLAQGFVLTGSYEIPALKRLRLKGLVHPSSGVIANVRVQGGQMIADFTSLFADNTRFSTSNSEQGNTLPRPPWSPLETHAGLAPAELYQWHLDSHTSEPAHQVQRISPAEFPVYFEQSWLEHQTWVAERGGYTRDELRAHLQSQKLKHTERDLDFMHERMLESALRNWYIAQPQPPVPVTHFANLAADLLIIHDDLSRDRMEYLFDRWSGGMDFPKEPGTPRELFDALAHHNSDCLTKILTKESDPKADFYCPGASEWVKQEAA